MRTRDTFVPTESAQQSITFSPFSRSSCLTSFVAMPTSSFSSSSYSRYIRSAFLTHTKLNESTDSFAPTHTCIHFHILMQMLQQVPGASPTGRFTTLVPLTLILIATAVKELIEDIVSLMSSATQHSTQSFHSPLQRRARADNRVNKSKVQGTYEPWLASLMYNIVFM